MDQQPSRHRRVCRRPVYFLLAVFSAIVTPVPNVFTMTMILVPSVVLFEVGYFVYRRRGG